MVKTEKDKIKPMYREPESEYKYSNKENFFEKIPLIPLVIGLVSFIIGLFTGIIFGAVWWLK